MTCECGILLIVEAIKQPLSIASQAAILARHESGLVPGFYRSEMSESDRTEYLTGLNLNPRVESYVLTVTESVRDGNALIPVNVESRAYVDRELSELEYARITILAASDCQRFITVELTAKSAWNDTAERLLEVSHNFM